VVTDEQIAALAATAKPFTMVLLSWAEGRHQDGADAIEREHQRRMVSLREDGTIAVLCPVMSDTRCGVAVMTITPDEATTLMAADPCVAAGMMTVEVHPCAGFPGDTVPG
jgi:uncharacterized protein YciI